MLSRNGSDRLGAAQRWTTQKLLLVLFFAIFACNLRLASAQTTWWPDPDTGIMWTGDSVDYKSTTFAGVERVCANLALGGYTGWRLPTLAEANATLAPATRYLQDDRPLNPRAGPFHNLSIPHQDFDNPVDGSKLKFNGFGGNPLYTSTPSGPGRVYTKTWDPPGSSTYSTTMKSFFPTLFCVRQMEPDLLLLSKAAHPPTPVKSLDELNAIAVMVQAEDAIDSDTFENALRLAGKASTMDPQSARAMTDLGVAQALSGDPSTAVTTLEKAHALDKKNKYVQANLQWITIYAKQLPTDPKATQGWVLVHDAATERAATHYDLAISSATQLIALEPEWPQGFDELGQTMAAEKRWPEAMDAFTKAKALDKHKETSAKEELQEAESAQKAVKH